MIAASLIKEWKLLARDLHGLAVLFVMPVVFMLIMSLALSKDGEPHHGSRMVLAGAAAEENRLLAEALRAEQMEVDERLPEQAFSDGLPVAAVQQDLADGRYGLLLYNPNAASAALSDERPWQIFVPPDTDPARLAAVKGVLQRHHTEIRLKRHLEENRQMAVQAGSLPPQLKKRLENEIAQENRRRQDEIADYLGKTHFETHYLSGGRTVGKPNAVQHSVPAWLIFGMFFIMIPLSNVMALEQQTNTLTRLRLARAPAAVLLAAKWLPYFLINQLQFAAMLLGRYLLPQIGVPALVLSGGLWPYAVLSAAVSAAALGYGLLVSVAAKSTEHAVVLGGGGIILMAGLGGIMVPDYVMPDFMQRLTWVSPMAWGLKAFQSLLLKNGGLAGIGLYLALLAAFALVCTLLTVWLYRGRLKTQARF